MSLTVVFLTVFVLGPLGFRALTRKDMSRAGLRGLVFCTAVLAFGGLALRFGLPHLWGQDVGVTFLAIGLIWAAWVVLLAFGAMALRRADPSRRMRRWTSVIGTIGTTVPWFGLAWAQTVAV